jgi:hypothetical protein
MCKYCKDNVMDLVVKKLQESVRYKREIKDGPALHSPTSSPHRIRFLDQTPTARQRLQQSASIVFNAVGRVSNCPSLLGHD